MGMLGNSVDKYVTGRMLQTSNDRRWSHLLAERWSHEPGELPSQLPRDTEIAIQLLGNPDAGVRLRLFDLRASDDRVIATLDAVALDGTPVGTKVAVGPLVRSAVAPPQRW